MLFNGLKIVKRTSYITITQSYIVFTFKSQRQVLKGVIREDLLETVTF